MVDFRRSHTFYPMDGAARRRINPSTVLSRIISQSPRSNNPVVRIVEYNTSPKQPDTITGGRVKMHAHDGSVDVDAVEDLLADGVEDGELERTDEGFRTTE